MHGGREGGREADLGHVHVVTTCMGGGREGGREADLGHVVTRVDAGPIRVDSAVLPLVVLDEVSSLCLDEVLTFVFHEGRHVETTVELC